MPKDKKAVKKAVESELKRTKLSQKIVPSMRLDEALRLGRAIIDNYAGKSATPLQVAKALGILPTSGVFRMLCGASAAYGLSLGGYNTELISLEPLALRILKPKQENDDYAAKIEAFLTPKIIHDFLYKYNGSPIPKEDIAKNVLEDMGVPVDRLDYVLNIILDEGENLAIISKLKDKKYVEIPKDLTSITPPNSQMGLPPKDVENITIDDKPHASSLSETSVTPITTSELIQLKDKDDSRLKRVFITHGKNRDFIEPIKKLLRFGEMEAIVSVEKTSVSVPVPEKVMNDMRGCGAAIIHVEGELTLFDNKAEEHKTLNPNVLIEIGAAMALYGKRFILLVKDGVKLPSNLQGLFEVRYNGDTLDGDATIRLLEAINDIKNQNLPN